MTDSPKPSGRDLEKYCARFYRGQWVGRGRHKDVRLVRHSIESKERKEVPKWIRKFVAQAQRNASGYGKTSFVHLHEPGTDHREDLVIMKATDWQPYVQAVEDEDFDILREER